ncbi:SRPBCC domain-containing protein [uncultured Brachybacterium sp.]|uniref:SRPBCC domain-containing protein n=1 Tax=uncultured Brachybacterium sp. TaxID=189680 RepID=UPI002615001A|nr:SRPBCC domain-containing protein [uncultured Brachybacterium sp.]
MTATPSSQLTAVTRTVTLAEDGNTVTLEQTFPVHPEELWSALTICSHLEVWFGRASGEVVEGGSYTLPDMETRGSVIAVEEPARLLLSWEVGKSSTRLELLVAPVDAAADTAADTAQADQAAGADEADQAADAEEQAAPVGSRFTLRHTVPEDAHWKTFGPAATGLGWDAALYALALHLQDPSVDLIPQLGDFAGSEEGEEFTRATAEAWFEAHIATGVDKKPARKASVRTAAFYLGEEPELS